MPDLAESLQGRDPGHLAIIAELWGLGLPDQDPQDALRHLVAWLTDPVRVGKILEGLSTEAREALDELIRHAGKLPWAQFTRKYGELRQMGAARRDREQPYKQPASAVEVLWYRGFLAGAFFDTPTGPQEFAYIPDDLLKCIPEAGLAGEITLGRPASAAEHAYVTLVSDRILDHACTLLAALRLGLTQERLFSTPPAEELAPATLSALLSACGLLDDVGMPLPEPVRLFLESARGEALAALVGAWKQSPCFNELRLIPGLRSEGNWINDPLRARQVVLGHLARLPAGTWWGLNSFIAAIKQYGPDFQRPSGDYDSWFIRAVDSGQYLRGFEHWDEVDGRLIRYLIAGPLHWLGVVDLGCPEASQEVTAFCLSSWSHPLLQGDPNSHPYSQTEKKPTTKLSATFRAA